MSELERTGSRLNHSVFKMADYTLRRTDVSDAADRARRMGRPIADARLGDLTVFGMAPYPRYVELVGEAIGDPKSWSYGDARGIEGLREILGHGNIETGKGGYTIPPDRVFLGPGVSGISRSLFSAMINRSAGDEVVIPEWSYIIYFAEAALSGAGVVNVPLTQSGEVDVERLHASISERTKAIFITTVGNPLGIAMRRETFADVIAAVNAREREFNHPIYLVADTMYECFRTVPNPIDPIASSIESGRIGPTIELYSISKMIGAPGARLGWMRLYHGGDFGGEIDAFVELMSRLLQPSLGSNSVAFQLALQRLYGELSETDKRMHFDMFRRQRRTEVINRVRTFLEALAGVDGIVFPECYYRQGRPVPGVLHSFYVMFGVDKALQPRGAVSQARELADFLMDRQPALPVLLATPADNFLENGLRGREQEFMRVVALFGRMDGIVEGVRRFVESKRE
jgi:aspartate/methionine/tyrosine aminotransferase